jgi:hypothetical protein
MTEQYRFIDSSNGSVGGRHYDIRNAEISEWSCDTTGPAVNEIIEFHARDDGVAFTLVPERRVMNRGFTLHEGGPDGSILATLTTRGFGHEWKVCVPDGAESFRIVDPTGKVEATLRFLFESFTDRYALISNGQIFGSVTPMVRPESAEGPGGVRGLLRRVLKASDWTLTLQRDELDYRLAVAAVLLLIERQIRGRGGMA